MKKKITISALILCLIFGLTACGGQNEEKAIEKGNKSADEFILAAQNAGYELYVNDDVDEILKDPEKLAIDDVSVYEPYDRIVYLSKPYSEEILAALYFTVYKDSTVAKTQFFDTLDVAEVNEAYNVNAAAYRKKVGEDLAKEIQEEDFTHTETYSSFTHQTEDRYLHIVRKENILVTAEVSAEQIDEVIKIFKKAHLL